MIDAIEILLEHDTAGDPITGLKWTRKTTEKIADVLHRSASPSRPTRSLAFSTRWISPSVSTSRSLPTPASTAISNSNISCSLRTRFQRQGFPIISVDSKKREMIGNFKNSGAKWDRSPVLVKDHDFLSDASGVGSPTAFTTRLATAASALESLTIPRPSPLIPSPLSGNARGCVAMAIRPNYWFWPTPAVATVALPWPGRSNSRDRYAIPSALPSPLPITRPAPPSGIPSSIACSPRFRRTGPTNPSRATKRYSSTDALPTLEPAWS